jgi:Response regulator containing CheY-like receiver, AAA-type ATPase, and DNA-binding domains
MSTILVVDDEETIRNLLRELLSPPHVCHVAKTVAEAIDYLQEMPFDVVLTDISLPDKSGLELLGLVRQFQPQTPVIVISGIDDAAYSRGLLEMGAFGYLAKPFHLEEVTGTVERAIESRRFAAGFPDDRRHAPRYDSQVEARVSGVLVLERQEGAEDDDEMLMVVGYTHDLSENGLALVVPEGSLGEHRVIGETFHIVLNLPAGAVSIEAKAVRYELLEEDKSNLIGVNITNMSGRDRVLFLHYLYLLDAPE